MSNPNLAKFLQDNIYPDGMPKRFLDEEADYLFLELKRQNLKEGEVDEKKLGDALFRGTVYKLPAYIAHINEGNFNWSKVAERLSKAYFADKRL